MRRHGKAWDGRRICRSHTWRRTGAQHISQRDALLQRLALPAVVCPFFTGFMLNFVQRLSCSKWYDQMIFLCYTDNVVYCTDWFSDTEDLCIPRVNPTWLWCVSLHILLGLLAWYFAEGFCGYVCSWRICSVVWLLFVCFLIPFLSSLGGHGKADLIKWVEKCSLFSFLERELL